MPASGPGEPASGDGRPLLHLVAARVRYPGRRQLAIDGIDLDVTAGELVGVAGRNGAGKSTLALVAAAFIPRVVRAAVEGIREIGGLSAGVASAAELLGRVGIVFSTPSNQLSGAKLTVREELAFGLENLAVPRAEMDERIESTLAELGVAHLADRLPTALSGGEQQRVAIAAILAMGPELLVLDEPTAQLDPAGGQAVTRLLGDRAAAGIGILVTEHREAVLRRARRIAVLDGGHLTAIGSPAEVLQPDVGGRAGIAVPALVELGIALGVPAGMALDEDIVAAALRSRADQSVDLRVTREAVAVAWEPVRHHPPTGIDIVDLVHRYPDGTEALRGVSISIGAGETVAIVGQNGSGKTTLVKHLVGILTPTAGQVLVGGRDVAGGTIAEAAHTVGFVFQDPDRQLFSGTVEREFWFGPRNLALDRTAARRAVEQALTATGLDPRRIENPYDLGLSDRKLVALGSVLAMDPAVLVLDEPTTGQDASGITRIGALVDAFAAAGRTVVAITHDMEFAARHFRRVVVMRQGVILDDGPPGEVFAPSRQASLASTGLELPALSAVWGRAGMPGAVPFQPARAAP